MFPSAMKNFARSEDGAVTVDWVVLTAAIIALVFAMFAIITQQSITVGANVVDNNLQDAAQYTPGFGSWTRTGAGDPPTPPGG
jgi:Flp pilus assembly protein TadG